jgi:hypothetical protein
MRYVALVVSDDNKHYDLYRNRLSNLPVEFSSEHSIEDKMKEENINNYRSVCVGV